MIIGRILTWLGFARHAIPVICAGAWPFMAHDAELRDFLIFSMLIYIVSMLFRISIDDGEEDDGERDVTPEETPAQKPAEAVRPLLRVVGK